MKKQLILFLMSFILVCSVTAQNRTTEKPQRNPEERARMMTTRMKADLGLSEAQEKEVYEINLKMLNEMENLREENKDNRSQANEKKSEIRNRQTKSLGEVLNKEQLEKFEAQQEQKQEKMQEYRKEQKMENRPKN